MNELKFDAIIFDFDGVLVESVDVKTKAFASLYSEYGQDVVSKVILYHLEHSGISRFVKFHYYHETLLNKDLSPDEEALLGERFSKIVEDAVVQACWVEGAMHFLTNHYRLLPLFVASGTPQQELERIIMRRSMEHFFRSVHGTPSTKGEIIQAIIQKHGFDRQRMLMVGDARADYEGAMSAGVNFIGRILERNNFFPDTVPVISTLNSLADFIRAIPHKS